MSVAAGIVNAAWLPKVPACAWLSAGEGIVKSTMQQGGWLRRETGGVTRQGSAMTGRCTIGCFACKQGGLHRYVLETYAASG